MLFGIQASKDIELSEISRSLDEEINEEIKLIKTENYLGRKLKLNILLKKSMKKQKDSFRYHHLSTMHW
ncbi:MAG: hypothetical protein J7K17_02995 [Candidatus Omnitrophica bacterium]|nr:hypothetical protein [Candidatus Omnitrophota bacterium]